MERKEEKEKRCPYIGELEILLLCVGLPLFPLLSLSSSSLPLSENTYKYARKSLTHVSPVSLPSPLYPVNSFHHTI